MRVSCTHNVVLLGKKLLSISFIFNLLIYKSTLSKRSTTTDELMCAAAACARLKNTKQEI